MMLPMIDILISASALLGAVVWLSWLIGETREHDREMRKLEDTYHELIDVLERNRARPDAPKLLDGADEPDGTDGTV